MTAGGDQPRRFKKGEDLASARAVVNRHQGGTLAGNHAEHDDATRTPAGRGNALEAISRELRDGKPFDYTVRGLPQLPAWFFQLHGQPVPDDAPDLAPPKGFAALMARRQQAALTAEFADVEPPGLPGGVDQVRADPATAAGTAPDPVVKTEALPGPAVADGPVRYCKRCGYVKSPVPGRGHILTCLGGVAPAAPDPDIAWAVEVRDQDGQVVDVINVIMPAARATLESALDGALTEVRNGQEARS
jgi:hypothetical protein